MLRKYATLAVLDAWRVPQGHSGRGLRKAAHRVSFDYAPRPGYLYVRCRAISSRTNDNHDTFPAGEIEKSWKTFLGKPAFVNHHNSNQKRARGVIVAAALHRDKNPDGSPDTWVELLHEIDAQVFPKFAKAILSGRVNRTSMGVDCEYSTCSACGNKATSPSEYCSHMPAKKGLKYRKRNPITGKMEEQVIHEICAGLTFFENSFLVEDPADPTAYVLDKPYLHKAAVRKTAAPAYPHPGRLQGGTCREACDYGGTHCAFCHEQVRINLHKTDTASGGWHHEDGMLRDHPATPADPQGVMDSIPGQQARKDQARAHVREVMHRQFEELSGHPLPRRTDPGMPPDPFTASKTSKPDLLGHFTAAGRRFFDQPLYHGTRTPLEPGEHLTVGQAEQYPNNPDIRTDPYVHATTDPAEAYRWGNRASSGQAAARAEELGRTRRLGPGQNEDHAYPSRVYRVRPTGHVEPDLEYADTEHDSYRSAHPMRVGEEVRPLSCYAEECGNAEHWPDHPHYPFLKAEQDEEDERYRERHGMRRQAITGEEAEPGHSIWAYPTGGKSPVAAEVYKNMHEREPGEHGETWYHGVSYHGPYHVIRHPDTREVWVVDREGRDASPAPEEHSYGNPERDGSWKEDRAYEHWHDLESQGPDAARIGTSEHPRFSEVARERTPAFPHSRIDPEDERRAERPDARVHEPQGHSPEDEWHGPYEVVKHPGTGEFHVVDNAGRHAPGRTWRGFDTQMQAERSRDYIDRRQQSKDLGRQLANSIYDKSMEILDPGGTKESRQSERNQDRGEALMTRYAGGRGKIKFDPDDEGGAPYYERDHYLPDGRPSGWYAKHYGGPFAEIYHRATGSESHEMLRFPEHPEDEGRSMTPRLHPDFDDISLGKAMDWWHGDTEGGAREHLEQTDPRIQRWKRRRQAGRDPYGNTYTAAGVPRQVEERWPREGTHCVNCGVPFTSEETDPENPQNWRDVYASHLCVECAAPRKVFEGTPIGKPPPAEIDQYGGEGDPKYSREFMHTMIPGQRIRRWTGDDPVRQSLSALQHEEAKRYAEPGDHPWFQANPPHKDNIKAAWYDTTQGERDQGKRWYPDAHLVATAIAHGDSAKGAGLLSAYSPRTNWPANMFNAARSIHEGRAMGTRKGDGPIMSMHWKPAERILAGEHHSQVFNPDTAAKTRAFAHLIEHGGNTEEDLAAGRGHVVIDRHAMSTAIGRRMTDEDTISAPIKRARFYHHVEQKYLDAADEISTETGSRVTPEWLQAAVWLRQIRKNNEEDSDLKRKFGGGGRLMRNKNDLRRWEQYAQEHHPELSEETMHVASLRRQAADPPLRVPPSVDTLRPEACPVCGDQDVFKGQRCPVCGFVAPPDIFRDPDIDQARLNRAELEEGKVESPYPEGPAEEEQIGSGTDADGQLMHPDQITPNGTPGVQPEDQVPGQGLLEPTGEEDELAEPGELDENGQPVEPEEEQLEGAEAQEAGAEEEQQGEQLEEQGEEEQAAGAGSEQGEEEAEEEGLSPGKEQDEDRKRRGGKMGTKRTAEMTAVTAQARTIDVLRRENAMLHAGLRFIAELAGVTPELNQIMHQADLANPAQPVPDPPQEPPTQSTEEALASGAPTGSGTGEARGPGHSEDDPSRPGTAPGSLTAVPAEQTTTAITPGVEMQTPPARQLTDVTAPVQGTNPSQDGGVPIEQRRIETDVRVDPDPLKASGPGIGGVGTDGTAFPWTMAGRRATGGPASPEDERGARTFAAIRLAKLRITAGLTRGDELDVATAIERDAALDLRTIEHEIGTLTQVARAAPQGQPRYPRGMAPRTAARSAPSFAGDPQPAMALTANYAVGDTDDSDLFVD